MSSNIIKHLEACAGMSELIFIIEQHMFFTSEFPTLLTITSSITENTKTELVLGAATTKIG